MKPINNWKFRQVCHLRIIQLEKEKHTIYKDSANKTRVIKLVKEGKRQESGGRLQMLVYQQNKETGMMIAGMKQIMTKH